MSKFNVKCIVCGKEGQYNGFKDCFMDGWFPGKNCMCYECGKTQKEEKKVESSYTNYIDIPQ